MITYQIQFETNLFRDPKKVKIIPVMCRFLFRPILRIKFWQLALNTCPRTRLNALKKVSFYFFIFQYATFYAWQNIPHSYFFQACLNSNKSVKLIPKKHSNLVPSWVSVPCFSLFATNLFLIVTSSVHCIILSFFSHFILFRPVSVCSTCCQKIETRQNE